MKTVYTAFLMLLASYFLTAQNPIVTTLTDQFNGSGGVKLGPDGMLYVADFGAGLSNSNGFQVWRIHPATGDREVFATGLQGASGNDFDSQGNLFQSNIAGGFISKITPDGSVSFFTNVGISAPVGIAIDGADNLYVCNCGSNNIRKVTSGGVSSLFSSGTIFKCPNGITFDHEGNLYVTNFDNSTVVKITPDGMPSFFASIPGNNNGHLTFYEPDTMLYINSHGSSSIYRAALDGAVTKIAGNGIRGNSDGPALSATFSRPNGIALSTTGDTLWVNSSIPTVNNPASGLNPSVVRMVTGLKEDPSGTGEGMVVILPLIKTAPNPADSFVTVDWEMPKTGHLSLSVFTLQGKAVQHIDFGEIQRGSFQKELDVSQWPIGIYMLSLVGEAFSANRKLVVER